jgi:hypothetical protein
MSSTSGLKHEVCDAVDALRTELIGISRAIHAEPELAFRRRRQQGQISTPNPGFSPSASARKPSTRYAANLRFYVTSRDVHKGRCRNN